MKNRPRIPEHVRRQVRQECGFGCVFCGAPVYVYDHIIDYAMVREHTVDNLALLCPRHDREKTSKRLHRNLVLDKRNNPFNKGRNISSPHPVESGGHTFWASAGGNVYMMQYPSESELKDCQDPRLHPVLVINDIDLIGVSFFHDGTSYRSMPSVRFFSENDQMVVALYEGELRVGLDMWDITFEGKTLKASQRARKIEIQMEISTSALQITQAKFSVDGNHVQIDKKGIFINGLRHPVSGISARATGGFLRFEV